MRGAKSVEIREPDCRRSLTQEHRTHLRCALRQRREHEIGCGQEISARRVAVHGSRICPTAGSAGHIHFRGKLHGCLSNDRERRLRPGGKMDRL
jgi:hypothetical protein